MRPQVREKSPRRIAASCICSNKWIKNNKEKTNKKNNSMQVIFIWSSTSRKWKWNLCFVHENIVNPFLDFALIFLPRRTLEYLTTADNSSPAASVLLIQKPVVTAVIHVGFFSFDISAQQLKPALVSSVDKFTAASALRLDCGESLFGRWSSSSSWRDQPAQTWCHSESAHVLRPKLTRKNQLGLTSCPGIILSEGYKRADRWMNVFSFSKPSSSSPRQCSGQPHQLRTEGKSAKYGVMTSPVSVLQEVWIRFLTYEPDSDWVLYCLIFVWPLSFTLWLNIVPKRFIYWY